MVKEDGGEIGSAVPWEPCLHFSIPVRADRQPTPLTSASLLLCNCGGYPLRLRNSSDAEVRVWVRDYWQPWWYAWEPPIWCMECVTFCQLKRCTKWCSDGSHRASQQSVLVCFNSIAPNAIAIRLHILLPPPSSYVNQPHLHHHLVPGFAQACLWGLPPWPASVEGDPAIFPSGPSPPPPPPPPAACRPSSSASVGRALSLGYFVLPWSICFRRAYINR